MKFGHSVVASRGQPATAGHQQPMRYVFEFEEALSFAVRLHAWQRRKLSDSPYVSHLLGVASLVLEHGGGRDEAIAALLHDAIEDQAAEYPGGASALRAEISRRFGPTVLDIVNACTDADSVPRPPWLERKQGFLARLVHVSDSARLVSCADKLHNARSLVNDLRAMGREVLGRFAGGERGTLWYYGALADAFVKLGPPRLADELARTVVELEGLTGKP